ncbi:MAG TPA: PAS domain-containing protein, partial [Bacteroidales bacterium]|nr:PAS domain-containing protein [Bacteroidales bacterium]
MKRLYYFIAIIVIIVLVINAYYSFYIYKQQIQFHTDMLTNQAQICSWEVEQSGYEFENEINYIVFSSDIAGFFEDEKNLDLKIRKLELFYFKYQNLVKNIKIIDNNKNVYSLFKDKTNHFISDFYISQRQTTLLDKEDVTLNNDDSYTYVLPVFKNNKTVVNILIKVNITQYIRSVFENYHLGSTLWQWLVDTDGTILTNNIVKDTISVAELPKILPDIKEGLKGSLLHSVKIQNSKNKYLSVYYPVRILTKDMGVVFSLETKIIIKSVITNSVIISASSFIVFIIIIIVFIVSMRRKNKETRLVNDSINSLNQIFESLPIGIMILSNKKEVKSINNTGAEIFGLKTKDELIGKVITDQFLISRNFQDSDSFSYTNNQNQYIYY